jgi:long-chain acyl-CoA synthetase
LAAQVLGAIPVPVYADAVAEEMGYVLGHAGVKIIVAQDQEQADKVLSAATRLPRLTHILYDEPRGVADYDDARLRDLAKLIDEGRTRVTTAAVRAELETRIEAGHGGQTSVILYTSGTTGRSKGVVMLAGRCVDAAMRTIAFDRLTDRDELLASLPLAWVGDHYLCYAHMLAAGFCLS